MFKPIGAQTSLQRAAALNGSLRWYPGAHFTDDFGAHIGLALSYEHMFPVRSYMDNRAFLTESSAYEIGARARASPSSGDSQ